MIKKDVFVIYFYMMFLMKKKKLMHLSPTNTALCETMDTNRKIRKALSDFREGTL